jgi:hypothetical protein
LRICNLNDFVYNIRVGYAHKIGNNIELTESETMMINYL